MTDLSNIVLVHGAWADGSCWSDVIQSLQAKGYDVTAPQFPLTSLEDDVVRLRQVLNRQSGPTLELRRSCSCQRCARVIGPDDTPAFRIASTHGSRQFS
jgi:hypothetical protein